MSGYCPSQDWDRYVDGQDEEAAAEAAWWKENKDRVLQVVCALISSGSPAMLALQPSELAECAAAIVHEIVDQANDPYTGEPL